MENNENKQDFYWYVPNQDHYESNVNPCQTCKHSRGNKQSSSDGSLFLGMLLLLAIVGCFILYSNWKADEAKLQNCLYIDEKGSLHSVKNGEELKLSFIQKVKRIIGK